MPTSRWPNQIVIMPRSGKPSARCTLTSISSSDRPITTSGITSGALTMPENSVRPVKRLYLTSAKAASVPSTTAPQAVMKAIFRLSHRPESISRSLASCDVPLEREAAPDCWAPANR